MMNTIPDVCGSTPLPLLPLSLIGGRVFVSQHGVFQVIDSFTFQVDAEQQSSELFSHGAVNAATTGRPGDYAGEFIYLQSTPFPTLRFCCFQLGSRANTCCNISTEPCVMQRAFPSNKQLGRCYSPPQIGGKPLCLRGHRLCPRAFSVPYVF